MVAKPELLHKYDGVIQEQLKEGIIERVDANTATGLKHYIPHHAVITSQKTTTKLRVVFDASAKTSPENKSLNECVYRGPPQVRQVKQSILRAIRCHTGRIVYVFIFNFWERIYLVLTLYSAD